MHASIATPTRCVGSRHASVSNHQPVPTDKAFFTLAAKTPWERHAPEWSEIYEQSLGSLNSLCHQAALQKPSPAKAKGPADFTGPSQLIGS
jgi:hypothetical protein